MSLSSEKDPQDKVSTAKWPILLWLVQLIPLGILSAIGCVRLVNGPPVGAIIIPIWILSLIGFFITLIVAIKSKGRKWLISCRYELLLCFATTLIAGVLIGEVGIRIIGTQDEDGNFFFRGHRLHPYILPIKNFENALQKYKASKSAVVQYDPDIGWVPKPNSENDLFKYNAETIRVDDQKRSYAKSAPSKIKRILLFGDSFTHGDEVTYKETWGYLLEEKLNSGSRQVEIINFGVNGYGIDQAFLRWKKQGIHYQPDIVIFGFQAENSRRNENIIRSLYNPFAGLPFSKPRFVLDGEKLVLKNSPTLPPEKLIAQLKNINDWDLLEFENFYTPNDYLRKKWHKSKLITFGVDLIQQMAATENATKKTNFSKSEMDLAVKIIHSFCQSVNSTGAKFIVVHLPRRYMLKSFLTDEKSELSDFIAKVSNSSLYKYVETRQELLKKAETISIKSLFNNTHYSYEGNKIIAHVLAHHLKNLH